MIYSQELEAQVLSGLIHNPDAYLEVSSVLKPEDFYHEVHEVIYKVIRSIVNNRETLDKTILATRLAQFSISFKDNINPVSYIDSLSLNRVGPKVLLQSVKELKKFSLRRVCTDMGKQIVQQMKRSGEWDHQEIVGFVDKLVYRGLEEWNSENDVIDLFDGLYDMIEDRGNNPVDEIGIPSPYPEFNGLYGGFKAGDVYVFCARPKHGKSSFLNHTAFHMSNMGGNKIPCLVLDTEMGQDEAADVKWRLASSLTGIDPWYFSTGNWRKSEKMTKIIREERVGGKLLRERLSDYNLHYRYLSNASIDNIIMTVKKWYYSHVGRGNPCIIVYDYIKMADGESNDREHEALGKKVNRLKELVTTEVNAPLLTAVQLNRLGDTKRKDYMDSSSAVSSSDRLLWFASWIGIFRKKTLEELMDETDQFGTHKLIKLESRFLGKNGGGHNDIVKKPDGNIVDNFINFSVSNFQVKEVGTAQTMYDKLAETKPNARPAEMPPQEERRKKHELPNENPFK